MKTRNDFITNSSSSSFIVSFKDEKSVKAEIESQFTGDADTIWSKDSKYKNQLLNNILDPDHRYSKDKVIKTVQEDIHHKIWAKLVNHYVYNNHMTYTDAYGFLESDEGQKLIDIECQLESSSIQSLIGDDEYIALIKHSHDAEDGVIEYEILPVLSCTKAIFNYG